VIEFAQSGLKPLIKFARRMGIEWHVLVTVMRRVKICLDRA
jgi:predicted ATP-dependent endonuclease of OLD family